jgi:hypothetical protein
MLPAIRKQARYAFRKLKPEAREEAVEEVVASACCAFARLAELGKTDIAYPSVLTHFGIKQFLDGRRVGNRMRRRDVLSPYAQRKKGIIVEHLDRFDTGEGVWLEAVVEDDRTPVLDQVAFRIDFPTWLATRSPRNRRIAEALALGHSTGEVARRFKVSSGRISQIRSEFHDSWLEFHGEKNPGEETGVTVS